ncbi:O-antigen ligase C-terminal domain-containing protein [Serratia marcescens]|uniref:PglL family O-oligosaccharyltransferase n=1 Tax=Serratia TaxID=613 RepID=UPI0018D94B5A|nr:Wzy polymerase domain-containing protein [Serratia marcescens]MBH2921324.1 O-antigen ligase C-terminal domain-containing protein [Serratia marcescens]MBH3027836.1 O-antigen ligase C-terminal domain-containing protein [Serratia marcescens]MBH3042208.1 O-antigen ligase C-terminal domain-containing protein [Serratia marcescens]MBH3103287.1 O-antigen ligase C-terminal domain-containing protein [Serratia marcescens]MBH3295659.1 O-antigen ligase C-terminal domain-containing protein [Serratia marc
MADKSSANAATIAVLPLLLIWMTVILPIYYPNMGGDGLALPQNILAWAVMALTTLIVTFTVCLGRTRLSLTPTARLLLLGIAVLALPLLYTRSEWREDALWRCAGLLGGWLFYVACLQLRLTPRQRNLLLYGLLFAVGVQALLAALQLFAPALAWVSPNGSRVYGVFQQPNVLGSFIATGLALALWLLLAPLSTSTRRQLPLLALLTAFSALLVLIQSRAAWLGGALAAALLLWRFAHQSPAASRWAGGALLLGITLGLMGLFTGQQELIAREGSNYSRLTMLQDTLSMILAKPLLGWGYGGFEYSFAHFRLQAMPWREVLEVAGHPHNEILLWWVEGGLPALAGIVLVFIAGALLLKRAWQRDREQPAGARVGLFLVLLPMLVHTQLEYPFYLSAPHWLAFLLLLALLDGQTGAPRPLSFAKALSLPVATAAVGVLVMAVFAWQGRMALTQSERTMLATIDSIEQMPAPAAWIYRERKTFDEQSHSLLVYNQTRDDALLTGYRQWADAYLQRRIDANVYATLIMILRYQGAQTEANARQREAAFLFSRDMRFR